MYCAKCGNELKNGEAFCPKCGAKVGANYKIPTIVGMVFAVVVIIVLMALNNRALTKKINEVMGTKETTITEKVEESTEEIIVEETSTVVVTETTKAQVAATTVPTTTVKVVPATTIPPMIQTSDSAVVSFTPPISGIVAAETQMQQQTAIVETETSKRKGAADGGPVTEEVANAGPGAYIAPTSAKSVVTDPDVVGNTIQEVKVKTTTKYTDSIEDDDNHTCKITIAKPNMQGKDQEETDALNSSLEELMDALIEDVESLVDDYDELPKSISLTSVALTSTTKANIFITISGSITPRSGSSKSLKYRITYDREEQNAEYNKI